MKKNKLKRPSTKFSKKINLRPGQIVQVAKYGLGRVEWVEATWVVNSWRPIYRVRMLDTGFMISSPDGVYLKALKK